MIALSNEQCTQYAWFVRFLSIFFQVFLLSILDTLTSFMAGLVTFAVLGHVQYILQKDDIINAVRGGPGLIFITYPISIKQMPTTAFWAFCFFLVLFILGLDCQFELLEVLVVSLKVDK